MKHIKVLLLSMLCLWIGINTLYAQDTGNGVLPGKFSISATDTVCFSQGNLQCKKDAEGSYEWRFAKEQYERLDTLNNNIGKPGAWFDLFGYGTSGGVVSGYRYYLPEQTSRNSGDAVIYNWLDFGIFILRCVNCILNPSGCDITLRPDYATSPLNGSFRSLDWGINKITNGGNEANVWHSLTSTQWNYLINRRANANALKKFTTIQTTGYGNVYGLLLLPDDSTSVTVSSTLSESAWKSLEAKGAVFLPTAGLRVDSTYYHRTYNQSWQYTGPYKGFYWTASCSNYSRGWFSYSTVNPDAIHFDEGGSTPIEIDHDFANFFGFSVRMARRIGIPVTFKYNNGIDKDTTIYVNYGDRVPSVPTPHAKKEGCTEYPFVDWGFGVSLSGQVFEATTYTARYSSRGTTKSYTVTFYNWDGTTYRAERNVQCNYIPQNPGTPVKNQDCDSTYTFTGWIPSEFAEAQNCTAYYATFSGTAKKYRVSWQNWDGEELHYDSLENGNAISIPSIPTPERTSQDSIYTFKGWSPNPADTAVSCSDVVITAVFESKPRFYEITWKDYNDTTLRVDSVEYDKTPEYGDDPVRLKDCRYTYEFAQWNPEVVTTVGDATYTAQYEPTDRTYPVTWYDYKGDVLLPETLECDDRLIYSYDDPEKPTDNDSVYFFDHWASSELYGTSIDGEYDSYEFHPVFTSVPRWYKIAYSYLDENEKVWKSDTARVEYNSTLDFDTIEDTRVYCDSTYTFTGWNPELETVTDKSNHEYTAVYESSVNKYDMKWVALDTTITNSQNYDSLLIVPEATDSVWQADSIYVFQGWEPTSESLGNKVPCQDTTFMAQYKSISRYYKVYYSYLDEEEKVWKTDSANVEFGKTLNLDTVAVTRVYCDSTYTFEGWTPDLETVTDVSNHVYTAVYSSGANTYDVTWLNWNDTVVFKETLEYKAKVNAPLNPEKTADDDLVWLFDGWTPEPALTMPCEDVVYKATFHSVSRYYDDTIVLHDTTIVVVVEYDSVPKLDSLTGVVEHCDSTYTFDHWSPQVRKHDTVPMTYVAVYKAVPTMHTVTWKNWDGSVRYTEDYELGKTINKPTPDPTRPTNGSNVYFFTGWSPVPSTMPCEDIVFVPQFDAKARYYNDTIVRHDDTVVVEVEYGKKPNLNGYKDTLVHCDSTYTFDHWVPADTTQDTMAIKFVAVYKATVNSYPVTWYNGDGTIIETTSYKYGANVIPPLVIPTKATEGGNVFFFTGWSPEPVITMPCEELVYTPVFDNKNQYYYDTVFLKYDTIYPVVVEYDSTPDLSKWEYPIVDCDYTYNFDHWEPVVGPQPADTISYKAVYTSSLNSYSLTWKNWDGSTYFTETKNYQDGISLPAGTPVRPADDGNVYFFTGWAPTPDATMPCANTVYTAQFDAQPRYYQDTLILVDDTIYPVVVEYDSMPDFSKYEYTTVHCDSTYTFNHWEPALGSHPADTVTYRAVYDVTPNTYTLTWKNWDGSTYFTETKEYLDEISTPAGTPVHLTDDGNVYFFTGWAPTPAAEMPCGNTVYTAQFDAQPRYYQDTLILVDDTIYPVVVEFDSMPDFSKYEYTTVHCDSTYTFNHWVPALGSHPADTVTYRAVYDVTPNTYTLTWKNWDGSTYFTETKEYLDEISIPAGTPVHLTDDGNVYFFTGWAPTPAAEMPCANTVYTAQFDAQPRYYQDTLILVDDTIYPVVVEFDSMPDLSKYEYTTVHCDSTYTFNHWEPALGSHPADTVTYRAVYDVTPNTYTLTWKNWDGTVIKSQSLLLNADVVAPADPTRPTDNANVYFFAGWDPEPVATMPCNDLTYTAKYTVKDRYYTDSLVLKDTTVALIVDYDSVPDLSGYTQTVVHCDSTYEFLRWSPKVAAQDTVYVEYVAEYIPRVNKHTVTWLNWDSTIVKTDAVNYDSIVKVPVTIPTKPSTSSEVYFFTGWTPEFVEGTTMPCEDLTYKATFEAKNRYYEDTIVCLDTTIYVAVEYKTIPRLDTLRDTILRCDTLYEWVAWAPTVGVQDTTPVKYTAVYRKTPVTHNVTWKNWNGSILYSEALELNEPIYAPADPSRPTDENFVYFFSGWDPTPATLMPCNDEVYNAQYIVKSRFYQDTIVRLNDIVYTDPVEYGTVPNLDSYKDTIFACDSIYEWIGWNPTPSAQDTTPIKYTAVYGSRVNRYDITWLNANGAVFKSETLDYGADVTVPAATPTMPSTPSEAYVFSGWYPTPVATMPCDDLVYVAQYDTIPVYGDVIVHTMTGDATVIVALGQTPDLSQYAVNVNRCDSLFVFDHWTPAVAPKVPGDVEYWAVYQSFPNSYNVTWKNGADTVTVTIVEYDKQIQLPFGIPTPTRPATQDSIYTFSGWSMIPGTLMGCGDTVFYATYTSASAYIPNPIVLKDTVVLDTVPYDSLPNLDAYTETVVHCDYTYTFREWSPAIQPQGANPVTYTALYDSVQNVYTVAWVNGEDTVYDYLHCGDIPSIADPAKDADCDKGYVFNGWTPAIVPVTGNIVYKATYLDTVRYYQISLFDYDSTYLRTVALQCGETLNDTCVLREGNDTINYRFTGWDRTVTPANRDTSYYAVYESEERVIYYDATLSYIKCTGDTLTLPSGAVIVITADGTVNDTVYHAARKPYEGMDCYNNDSLVDMTVYTITFANYKNPLEGALNIACVDEVVQGMPIDLTQTMSDVIGYFVGNDDELIPDWDNSEWQMLDGNGNWVAYTGADIRDHEIGDTVYMRLFIPTNCDDIYFSLNANGCDMSVHQANADNCPDCQNDTAVIAVYDWLLMYEHARMQSEGYNVTPDKVYWYAIGGDDWDNLNDWTIPYALDDEYLGNGYYYTINQAFNGTGDYYALVDVTDAGARTLPCLGIMRSQKFHYAYAPANAPAAQLYPSEVRNSDVVYVVGLQSGVKNDIYVYDMRGQLVSHDTVTEDHYEFHAAGAAGTYRVVVITENNKQTLSFIIL